MNTSDRPSAADIGEHLVDALAALAGRRRPWAHRAGRARGRWSRPHAMFRRRFMPPEKRLHGPPFDRRAATTRAPSLLGREIAVATAVRRAELRGSRARSAADRSPSPAGQCRLGPRAVRREAGRTADIPPSSVTLPAIARIGVVLPAPFGPRSASNSPSPSDKVAPSSAVTAPNRLRAASIFRTLSCALPACRTTRRIRKALGRRVALPANGGAKAANAANADLYRRLPSGRPW